MTFLNIITWATEAELMALLKLTKKNPSDVASTAENQLSWEFKAITNKEESSELEFVADTMIPANGPVKATVVQAIFDTIL